jgi:bifunctional non-homologous end joining protein LigD
MRAPAYKGLRTDKPARDVVREEGEFLEDAEDVPEAPSEESVMPASAGAASPAEKIPVVVDGRALTLTNLSKVLYPADGFTKAEVLDYYQRISPVLLRHVADRPMTLKRYPEGVDGQAFFQKHAPAGTPDWVRTEDVESRSSRGRGGFVRHVVLDDLPALIWAANLAGLELHVPMWRLPGPDPDLIVFDLDPGEPATIVECCRVAEALRPLLAEAGLAALPKTSGGKGLQLYAKVSGLTSEDAIDQALRFAQALERDRPDLVTSRMTRSLRPGKVFIDWSQNKASKTTVAPYSLRARARPTVSTPVTWDEVAACRRPADLAFTAAEVPDRVAALGDLWEPLA